MFFVVFYRLKHAAERRLSAVTKQELKDLACHIIDEHHDQIMALGDSIFAEPETGWKEFKTAAKIKNVFESLGFPTKDQQCITGVIAQVKGREKKLKVAVMGELDALGVPDSPYADPKTGAAHMCGHHCMIAALSGVAYALHDPRITGELSGDVALMAVPAEEFIEMGYRGQLRREGTDAEGNPFPVREYEVSGSKIQVVEMLPGYTHNIINLSATDDLVTIMWANEAFNPNRPDTYFDPVKQ